MAFLSASLLRLLEIKPLHQMLSQAAFVQQDCEFTHPISAGSI